LGKLMLFWTDGYEQYGTNEAHMLEGVGGAAAWSEVTTGWALSTANPATQSFHMRLTDDSNGYKVMRRAYGIASQVAGLGYRFSVDDLPSNESNSGLIMAAFRDVSNQEQCMVIMGTEGSVIANRGGSVVNTSIGGTTIDRSNPAIAAGGYHHFEVKSKIDNSAGLIEVRVNEVTILNLTGIDTQSTGNASSAQIIFGTNGTVLSSNAGFGTMDIDDTFAWNDDNSDPENTVVDFVGDKGCYYLPVNADTATADWLKSSGVTGYSLLDELDPIDSDYIADSSGVARSIFDVAALPANVAEVIAMMPVLRARKEESGSVTLRAGVVVGTDESYTPDNSPSTQFAYMTPGPKTVDPSTGVAWANDADPKLLIERTV
jgi:hypothetical protein